LRRQCRMETETRRALELESAVRQGAGLTPCCADQKEGKGTEADANTADRELGKRRVNYQTSGQLRMTGRESQRLVEQRMSTESSVR
jgi:hypothetical protein